MEVARNDSNAASKRKEEAQQEGDQQEGEHGSKRLKGAIEAKAFSCWGCAQPLRPPIFECPVGQHFFCSPCRNKLPGNKCPSCSGSDLKRSYGMDHAVRSILVDCRYAEHGCAEKPAYYDKAEHEKACPNAPCFCPEAGCGFVGLQEELLDHLTGGDSHHGWPSTTFHYRVAFDLRIVEPGVQVLRSMDDGQLFLVSARQAAAPPHGQVGLAVSLVGVLPYHKPTGYGCTVSLSCFRRSYLSTTTLDDVRPLRISDWPPAECVCVVPRGSDGPGGDGGVVLTLTFVCAEADDKYDDIEEASDTETDEEE